MFEPLVRYISRTQPEGFQRRQPGQMFESLVRYAGLAKRQRFEGSNSRQMPHPSARDPRLIETERSQFAAGIECGKSFVADPSCVAVQNLEVHGLPQVLETRVGDGRDVDFERRQFGKEFQEVE